LRTRRSKTSVLHILAIDPSPTSTGWALELDGKTTSGTREWVRLARKETEDDTRVQHQAILLAQDFIASRIIREPMTLFIEEPRFNPRMGFDLWGTGAVIGFWRAMMAAAHRAGYARIESVQPQTWRKAVLGNGKAKKSDARKWCRMMGAEFHGDDEAEALCILHYGRSVVNVTPAGVLFAAADRRNPRRLSAWQSGRTTATASR
jgi:Holliday junction resolvasome RuvABC endonuclease subunit